MSEGLRIRPRPDLAWPDDGLIVVRDHARPYPPPADGTPLDLVQPVCVLCGEQHFCKAYHVQLRAGTAIVSTTIWEQLERLRTDERPDNPFELVNPVAEPPTQGLVVANGGVESVTLIEKYAMPIRTN